jgi:ectoine hydroxylase-related dioxygenase (phytanoyl-CoA dioxygenase family)
VFNDNFVQDFARDNKMVASTAADSIVSATATAVTPEQVAFFHREGYLIVRGLFSADEAQALAQHYMDMHARRAIPHYQFVSMEEAKGDILKVFSRIMQPHRFDEVSKKHLLDPRVANALRALLDEEPVAAQSMLYFKPPGARGQAFHQDNFYLRVRPKNCIAAWVALDRTDPENGGLQVCPGTHTMEVACPQKADLADSFTTELVPPPEGTTPVPVILEPGDTLFFNGSVVHGSTPNTSKDRWRRSFICHYAPESMHEISAGYQPILDMSGEVVKYENAQGGGPCGTVA